jgi:outer membrane immunogenic protein
MGTSEMKLLSGLLGLTLTSAVALASANAADLYRGAPGGYKDAYAAPVAAWTGFYLGVNGGYGWTDSSDSAYWQPEGGFGGGQIGYNWQGFYHPNLVVGIEADFQGGDISDSSNFYGDESSLNYFGTVRGRIGFAFDRTLIYGTGGFAYGEVEHNYVSLANFKDTQAGWVAGGGVEYKVSPAWSVKGEYQFLSLDATDTDVTSLTGSDNDRSEVHTFRVGLNYHFGKGGYDPLK